MIMIDLKWTIGRSTDVTPCAFSITKNDQGFSVFPGYFELLY